MDFVFGDLAVGFMLMLDVAITKAISITKLRFIYLGALFNSTIGSGLKGRIKNHMYNETHNYDHMTEIEVVTEIKRIASLSKSEMTVALANHSWNLCVKLSHIEKAHKNRYVGTSVTWDSDGGRPLNPNLEASSTSSISTGLPLLPLPTNTELCTETDVCTALLLLSQCTGERDAIASVLNQLWMEVQALRRPQDASMPTTQAEVSKMLVEATERQLLSIINNLAKHIGNNQAAFVSAWLGLDK